MKTTFEIKEVPKTRFGYGSLSTIVTEIDEFGGKNILLIVDKQMEEKGLTKGISELLGSSAYKVHTETVSKPILSMKTIIEACETMNLDRYDIVVGYGGWRCTDLAKILGVCATNSVTLEQLRSSDTVFSNHGLPVFSISTTPPNGAEIDTQVFIRDHESKDLVMIDHPFLAPRLAVIDPDLMVTIPPDLTASTGIDALTHAIEALISMNSSPFSEILALQSIALINENLNFAFRQPDNLKARYNVALGSLYSALALNMTGSGLIHALAYPLTARYGIAHAQASALMSLHALRYNAPVVPSELIRIARLLGCEVQGVESDAQKALSAFEELIRALEHPMHLSAYNIPGIDLHELTTAAMEYSDCLKRNPRKLEKNEVQTIYRNAL